MCTGELGGQGKDHDVLPCDLGTLNGLGERVRVDLAGSGKLIALDEEFVESSRESSTSAWYVVVPNPTERGRTSSWG